MKPSHMLLTFSCLCLLRAGPVLGQGTPPSGSTAAPTSVPPKRVLYYDAQGRQVPTADWAEHREEMVYRDSIGGNLRIYYPSGGLRRLVPYLHFGRGMKYGMETSFYENGELKSRCPYQVVQSGPCEQFYRNGQLRSRSAFGVGPDGKVVPAQAFLANGNPATDHDAHTEKMPALKGSYGQGSSTADIVKAVQMRTTYPVAALRAQASGRVLVSFMVDDAGFVRDVRIDSAPGPYFNETVLQAVAGLGRFSPGEMDGDTLDVSYTIPITFTIQ